MEDARMPYEGQDVEDEGSEIKQVLGRHEASLLAIDAVDGIGITHNEIGDEVIAVYLREGSAQAGIPAELDGYPVVTFVTGGIDALGTPS